MSHSSMLGSRARAGRWEMSDLVRSRRSRRAECRHVDCTRREGRGQMTVGLKDFSRSYFFLGDRLEKFSPLLKGADLNLGIDKSSVKISISKLRGCYERTSWKGIHVHLCHMQSLLPEQGLQLYKRKHQLLT